MFFGKSLIDLRVSSFLSLVDHLYTSPTAIRTIRKEDSEGSYINKHDLKHLRSVTLVGERCDVPTFKWVQDHLKGKFVNDSYWQT